MALNPSDFAFIPPSLASSATSTIRCKVTYLAVVIAPSCLLRSLSFDQASAKKFVHAQTMTRF
jgi:hypothetical protein